LLQRSICLNIGSKQTTEQRNGFDASSGQKVINMAYTTTNTSTASLVSGRIAAFFADLAERSEKRRVYRTTFHELNSLSTRDLADLGINRSTIKSVAYEAAYKS
jgi:uncharacterized protein YjiS (DUF1127 family)